MNLLRQPLSKVLVQRFSAFFSIKELKVYQILILLTTFCVYASYHISRRSLSVVKPALNHRNCSELIDEPNMLKSKNETDEYWCDWSPFIGPHSRSLLGTLDLVFLISYSLSMYLNGAIAERSNLRYFLTIGMICAGITNSLFGMAYYLNIHSIVYFYAIQVITGMAQSTGWPGVLATVGHWFGPSKRGLIFGIWNSHINVGNIVGAALAGHFVQTNWGLSFIVPGILIASVGVLVFLFLVPSPKDVDMKLIHENYEEIPEKGVINNESETQKITIIEAIKIPGVIEFSICLLFAKLVSYTFLDWLPYYIAQTNANISSSKSAYMTIAFDMGGILGGITAGYISDRTGGSAITCIFMLIFAIPSLYFYYLWGNTSNLMNELLQFIAGVFVNAPYALITTAVSAELGSKVPSKSALATVSAIIDATGSFGSAIGPSLAGFVSEYGWDRVFIMVMVADLLALISILRIGIKDFKKLWQRFMIKPVSRHELSVTVCK